MTSRLISHSSRFLLLAILAATVLVGVSPVAMAKPKFSSLAIDARTGAVISADDPDGLRHPASLTKMMTLYILFQELKARRVKMSTPLRVSARAAGMAPSKLGLKPGSTITVEQAIKALVIKSANDVAATVGENLGRGSEAAFAERMTRTARTIGMKRTVFRNASGLPNPAQVTTARDMATLGLRLMRDFPQYYPYFRATSFTFKGRLIQTHNRLLGKFEGTDGIKTGYIGAAGFNLVTSTKRDGKRIVGVVLGARSSATRNAYMMSMISKAFPKARAGNTIAAVAGSSVGAVNPIAQLKGTLATEAQQASAAEVQQPDASALAEAAEQASAENSDEDVAEATAPVEQPKVKQAATQPKRLKIVQASAIKVKSQKSADAIANLEQADGMMVSSLPNAWGVQISSFASKEAAQSAIVSLRSFAKAEMKNKKAFTVAVKKGDAMIYRVVISGFSERTAKLSCSQAYKLGKDCAVILPQG